MNHDASVLQPRSGLFIFILALHLDAAVGQHDMRALAYRDETIHQFLVAQFV